MIEEDVQQGEATKDKQGASVRKTSIEIPVVLLHLSLFTKHALPLQEVQAHIPILINCCWVHAHGGLKSPDKKQRN